MGDDNDDFLCSVYVITLWSGGAASKSWKSIEKPVMNPHGTGVTFTDMMTRLSVQIIGDIMIEEYEQDSKLLEQALRRPIWNEDADQAKAPDA